MPDLSGTGSYPAETHQWLGRADALVQQASTDIMAVAEFRAVVQLLNTAGRPGAIEKLKFVLYRVLSAAELAAPASAKGAFIPVGSSFDAFAALAKVLQSAQKDVLIVDPYMDEAALTDFGCAVPDGIPLRCP